MTVEREIGALQARMAALEDEVHAMRADLREIRDALVTARGGWRVLTVVIGLSLSIGAFLGKLVPAVMALPRP